LGTLDDILRFGGLIRRAEGGGRLRVVLPGLHHQTGLCREHAFEGDGDGNEQNHPYYWRNDSPIHGHSKKGIASSVLIYIWRFDVIGSLRIIDAGDFHQRPPSYDHGL